jgi:hypothetical protein
MLKSNNNNQDDMYEFKGSTSAKLDIIFGEIKGLREDVENLKNYKAWTLGMGATAGFLAGILKDFIKF